MKLYVSGKFDRWQYIGERIAELEALGCTTTYNWTTEEARALSMKCAAMKDIEGAIDSELHVIIIDDPAHHYRGTWCEVGASLACLESTDKCKKIVICNLTTNKFHDFPFCHHPRIKMFFTWKETKSYIVRAIVDWSAMVD